MAKSRLAPALLTLLLGAAPAAAHEPVVALSAADAARLEQAMHRKAGAGCSGGSVDDILVCARRLGGHGQRMAFAREPGEIVRHLDEGGSGVEALAADHCIRLCDVGVTVNLIAAARAAPKIVRHILGKD